MKTTNKFDNFYLLHENSSFFKDSTGKIIIDAIESKKEIQLFSVHQLLLKKYFHSHSYKINDLWHHYLLNRFTQFSSPVHESFYMGFDLPEIIKTNYLNKILLPLKNLFQDLNLSTQPKNQNEMPFLEERKKLYQSFIYQPVNKIYNEVKNYFFQAGSGYFSDYFYYEWDKDLKGVPVYPKKDLNELAGYESQKSAVLENTKKYLLDQPANHVFLYGSRGTGKTSLIKALLNEFKDEKLRLIKVFREKIEVLPDLFYLLKRRKEKFIVNLDDISYDEGELIYKKHKVAIDSFFDLKPRNVLLYATSNSQEIVKYFRQETTDNFVLDNRGAEERKLEMPHRQIYDERRAFTERFGLSVFFGRTDEETADKILESYRLKNNIQLSLEDIKKKYHQWVIYHGAVNGRTIENFFKYLSSF